jgi:hypothetical protein
MSPRIVRAFEATFVYLCIHLVFLNSCFVNFNLRRSCKLGLRRTWCHYGFIVTKCLLVAKRGVCSTELIPNRIFLSFGSKVRLSFLWDASILLPVSCFVREKVLHLRTRVPRRFRRRSPLAQLPASSILLTLAILRKMAVANPDMLSNFCSKFCTYQCNWCWTVSKFWCK